MIYDTALVLGRGVYSDGSIPESAKATIRKAVELLQSGEVKYIICSGKYSYRLDYIPPHTEAAAMKEYAITLGAPANLIITEDESQTTGENMCNAKEILIKNNWKSLNLVTVYPHNIRSEINLSYVFGTDYTYKVVVADFTFPPKKLHQQEESEKEKVVSAKLFFEDITPGDHKKIKKLAVDERIRNTPSY